MRRFVLAGGLVLPAVLSVLLAHPNHLSTAVTQRASYERTACQKVFTVAMAQRAARAVYAGTRNVTQHDLRVLANILRCQRNVGAGPFVRSFYRHQRKLWHTRRDPPWNGPTQLSWFDDSAALACRRAPYGFASRSLPCGAHVTFKHGSAVVTGTVEDYGPATWTGRDFDAGPQLRNALGCGDLCDVMWR